MGSAGPAQLATLRRHRFVIMANGYASAVPAPSSEVHGILWRITPRDLAALDAYENVAGGLYSREMLPVISNGRSMAAFVYLGAEKREGLLCGSLTMGDPSAAGLKAEGFNLRNHLIGFNNLRFFTRCFDFRMRRLLRRASSQ